MIYNILPFQVSYSISFNSDIVFNVSHTQSPTSIYLVCGMEFLINSFIISCDTFLCYLLSDLGQVSSLLFSGLGGAVQFLKRESNLLENQIELYNKTSRTPSHICSNHLGPSASLTSPSTSFLTVWLNLKSCKSGFQTPYHTTSCFHP